MIPRKFLIAGAAAVAVGAGAAGAIAATSSDERKERESAVLADAAKRLDVSPSELRSALGAAQDAQIDQAVKDGKLTQAQADEIKKRRAESGTVLGGPGGGPGHGPRGFGGPGGRGFGGPGGPGGIVDAAATALGLERDEFFEKLRDGDTLAEIAKAEGKTLASVKAAVKKAVTEKADAALKAGDITQEQRDHVVEEFDEHFDRFASGEGPGRGFGRGGHHRFGPGGPDMDPPSSGSSGSRNENGATTLPAPETSAS